MNHRTITYRNGSHGRLLCTSRPNTSFCVMSMREDGSLLHHLSDGCYCYDHSPSEWDIVEGPEEPSRSYVVATRAREDKTEPGKGVSTRAFLEVIDVWSYEDPRGAAEELYTILSQQEQWDLTILAEILKRTDRS